MVEGTPQDSGFMQVPVDDELPDTACDFVHARGARFNEGVGGWSKRWEGGAAKGKEGT